MKAKTIEEVIKDLKAQCDSKASAVADMLEDMRFNMEAKDFTVLDCADEVADMGEWGNYAAEQLRGRKTEKAHADTYSADDMQTAAEHIETLAGYLAEAHEEAIRREYVSLLHNPMTAHKEDEPRCSYCAAIAKARAMVKTIAKGKV